MPYEPMMSREEVELRLRWHNNAYAAIDYQKEIRRQYLSRRFIVPREVSPPAWMSKLLGKTILQEVEEGDRVLDMGTGCGVNAILAASKSINVIGADVNRYAVESARRNAILNNVETRIKFVESDLFQNVRGKFDLIVFDPPFRWFKPRDIRERAVADHNFETMTAFFAQVKARMKANGRILVEYGDTGDIRYFLSLVDGGGFRRELMRSRTLVRDARKWGYYVWKLTK